MSNNALREAPVIFDRFERGVKNLVNFLGVIEGGRLSLQPLTRYEAGFVGEA